MSKETTDTLGNQKRLNYALRATTKKEFIDKVLDGLTTAPGYFAANARLNKEGYEPIDRVLQRGSQALAPDAFEAAVNEIGGLVLDVRQAEAFAQGFIPNAINIGLDGQFAPWVGALIPDLTQPIALVTPAGQESETVLRLARVGYDQCIGFLDGGFDAWQQAGKEVDTIESISADTFASRHTANPNLTIVDVRKPDEYVAEHVERAKNLPLHQLNDHMTDIRRDEPVYVHCAGGYRSMVANSILKARGFHKVVNVAGGLAAIRKTNVPVVASETSVAH